jgi:hypothetical protein
MTRLQEAGQKELERFTDIALDPEKIRGRAEESVTDDQVKALMDISGQIKSTDFLERTIGYIRANLQGFFSQSEMVKYLESADVSESGIRERVRDPREDELFP